jgi:hypothetical protein
VSGGIPESDWRVFRELRPLWLQRYCAKVNKQLVTKLTDPNRSEHERYLDAYKFIHRKDQELGDAFSDFRRSTAILQIAVIRNLGVVTAEELQRFSGQTKKFTSDDHNQID